VFSLERMGAEHYNEMIDRDGFHDAARSARTVSPRHTQTVPTAAIGAVPAL